MRQRTKRKIKATAVTVLKVLDKSLGWMLVPSKSESPYKIIRSLLLTACLMRSAAFSMFFILIAILMIDVRNDLKPLNQEVFHLPSRTA